MRSSLGLYSVKIRRRSTTSPKTHAERNVLVGFLLWGAGQRPSSVVTAISLTTVRPSDFYQACDGPSWSKGQELESEYI
jgi:hypothetical protein